MAEWSFGRVQGGVVEGFEHSGIDLFKGHRLDSMIRECIQNSLDAKDDDVTGPVEIAITLDDLDVKSMGLLNQFDDYLKLGLIRSNQVDDAKAKTWYQEALRTVDKKAIRVLGFHDANTIGLMGSSDKSTVQKSRWLALVAGQGVNLGQAADGLGGFGHGSNAAFAMSKMRLAYYLSSSVDENDEPITRFQGHCLLQSLFLPTGEQTTRDGFFGAPSPVKKFESDPLLGAEIPSVFSEIRNNSVGGGKGTSVFICDPYVDDVERSWREILVSIVSNFGYAFLSGSLRVALGDGTVIDSETLVDAYKQVRGFENDDAIRSDLEIEPETWRNLASVQTLLYPDISGNGSALVIPNFGQVYWYLRLGTNVSSKRVSVAREPGMVITDRAPELGRNAFGKFMDFDLLVVVRRGSSGQSGAEVIKAYEDPTHKKLEENRLPENRNLKTTLRSKYRSFQQAIKKDILEKFALAPEGDIEQIEIDGLLNPAFLGEESDLDGMTRIEIVKGAKSKRTPKWPTLAAGKDGPGGGAPPEGGGGAGQPGGGDGTPPPAKHGPFLVDGVTYERSPIGKLQVIPTGAKQATKTGSFVEIRIVGHQLLAGPTRLGLFVAGETLTQEIELRQAFDKPLAPGLNGTVPFGNGHAGRQEIKVWLPEEMLSLAFGGELYRGI